MIKRLAANIVILAVSSAAALGLCEFGSRIVLNPADYLSVEMVEDNILGAIPSPALKRTGFDAWGFRNPQVPEKVDVVTIGDSHTYGNTATMEDSWPYALARLTGRTVYNMGMGGYGPNQYYYLLKTKAMQLRPRTVICALYMGDDFENAFLISYGLEYWKYLRNISGETVSADIWQASPVTVSWHKKFRVWLSRHSVVYQLVFHGPLMGQIQGETQIRNAARLYDSATSLNIPSQHILEAFLPKNLARNLDQDSQPIREGMRITFRLLQEMKSLCQDNHVQFVVVVIPTKEAVFAEYFGPEGRQSLVAKLLTNEALARHSVFRFLTEAGIDYVDALPSLKRSAQHQLYARTAADMHPNKNGYKVIAESVAEALMHRMN